jgi:ribonuclease HI
VTPADGDDARSRERPPAESLTPLAARVLDVLVRHEYDLSAAVAVIDDAVPGIGGLFDPGTSPATVADAVERVLERGESADAADTRTPVADERSPASAPDDVVVYVDGSARSNPGPAGAGAVVQARDGATLAELGRPVGSRADNNTAEYAALLLGLEHLARHVRPERVEVRIDSMTVVRDVWGDADGPDGVAKYREPIRAHLAALPEHDWTHLVDSDPNPADALATVGADLAGLGPGA